MQIIRFKLQWLLFRYPAPLFYFSTSPLLFFFFILFRVAWWQWWHFRAIFLLLPGHSKQCRCRLAFWHAIVEKQQQAVWWPLAKEFLMFSCQVQVRSSHVYRRVSHCHLVDMRLGIPAPSSSLPQVKPPFGYAAVGHQLLGAGCLELGALKSMSSSKSLGIKCHFAFRDKLANLTRKLFISSLLSAKEFFLHFFFAPATATAFALRAFTWHFPSGSLFARNSVRPFFPPFFFAEQL